MRRSRESATALSGRFDSARVGRAVALALGVVVVHAWLLRDGSHPAAAGVTATPAPLTVRQIRVVPTAGPALAALAPALETPAAPVRGPMRGGSDAAQAVQAVQAGAMRGELAERRTEPVSTAGRSSDPAPAGADPADAESRLGAVIVPDAPPPPVYATRAPSSTESRDSLRRGTATGEALLSWRADADRDELQLRATLPSGADLEQRSRGGFDAAGLAPVRLADRRRGRDQRAANFQRERGLITFSGSRAALPVVPGAQDRLTWLVQLAAIAAAAPQGLREGSGVPMLVVGARSAASL